MKLAKLHMKHIGDVRNRIVMLQKVRLFVFGTSSARSRDGGRDGGRGGGLALVASVILFVLSGGGGC